VRYSAKDFERSRRWARERALYDDRGIAELIADVRREALEEAGLVADAREPIVGGNLDLTDGVARVVKPHPAVKLYVSHFATCAQADAHRKGRRP